MCGRYHRDKSHKQADIHVMAGIFWFHDWRLGGHDGKRHIAWKRGSRFWWKSNWAMVHGVGNQMQPVPTSVEEKTCRRSMVGKWDGTGVLCVADSGRWILSEVYRNEQRSFKVQFDKVCQASWFTTLSDIYACRHRLIVIYKTAFYSFYLPVALAMRMARIPDSYPNPASPNETIKPYDVSLSILLQIGERQMCNRSSMTRGYEWDRFNWEHSGFRCVARLQTVFALGHY